MRRTYSALLGLYPAKYRARFNGEMVNTFEQAAVERRKRGGLTVMWFAAWEFAGILTNLPKEWLAARRGQPDDSAVAIDPALPEEIREARRSLQTALKRMEFAIAHHDFPAARRYSREEEGARAQLDRLLGEGRGVS